MVRFTFPSFLPVFAIAIGLFGPPSARADDFQWETMVHYWIRLNRDFEYSDKRIDSYMQAFRPQQWNKVRNNEAIIDDARKELKKLMEERAKEVKPDATLTLHLPMRLGEHDRDQPGFPIVQMSESTYWITGGNRYTQALPSQFHMSFRNTQQFPRCRFQFDDLAFQNDMHGSINTPVIIGPTCHQGAGIHLGYWK